MRLLVLGMLALSLGGCLATTREPLTYTQAEINAINAETACKALARNLVQVARCDVRR
jgi:hypothetical protein